MNLEVQIYSYAQFFIDILMHSAKVVENELRFIVADQGANVTEIVELVRENETILDAMKHNLRESFVAEMARLILRSDTDGDMTVRLVYLFLLIELNHLNQKLPLLG